MEDEASLGYNTKYFTKNGTNITAAVKSVDGYDFTARPNKARKFRVTVKRVPGPTAQGCVVPRLNEAELIQFTTIRVNTVTTNCMTT